MEIIIAALSGAVISFVAGAFIGRGIARRALEAARAASYRQGRRDSTRTWMDVLFAEPPRAGRDDLLDENTDRAGAFEEADDDGK